MSMSSTIILIVFYAMAAVLLLDSVMIGILLKYAVGSKQPINKNINDSDNKVRVNINKEDKDKGKGNGPIVERHESRRGFWYELIIDPNTGEVISYRDSNKHSLSMKQINETT